MAEIVLTEKLLAEMAGWEAMKHARGYLEAGQVLSSNWTPPLLKGVVSAGGTSYRAGLVIRSAVDVENICSCRDARERGIICAHSVGVGLHHLKPAAPAVRPRPGSGATSPASSARTPPTATASGGRPAVAGATFPFAAADDVDAAALSIHVILPNRFEEAFQRGRLTLFLEAERGGRRMPLDTLPLNQSYACGPEDRALLEFARERTGAANPGLLALDPAGWIACIRVLVGHPRVTVAKREAVTFDPTPIRLVVRAQLEANGEIVVSVAPFAQGRVAFAGGGEIWVLCDHRFQPVWLPQGLQGALGGPLRIKRGQVPAFLSTDLPRLQEACDVSANFVPEDFICETSPPRFHLALAGGLAQLQAHLQCAYGARILTAGVSSADDSAWLPDPDSPRRYLTRDAGAERAALERLRRAGFGATDAQGRCVLLGEDRVLRFLASEYPRLEKEWTVTLEERLQRSTEKNLERIEPEFRVLASGQDWFELEVAFNASSGQPFSAAEIQQLLLSGGSHARLKNGRRALLDTTALAEFQEVLRDCAPQQQAGRYRFEQRQAGFLRTSLEDAGLTRWQAPPGWSGGTAKGAGAVELRVPPMKGLECTLRPYQEHGVGWLWFLRENGFGGILADEMGLGKTVQAIGLLLAVHAGAQPAGHPSLVVCPTSLVFNWVEELRRFAPGLRVLALDGPQRAARFATIPEHQVIVTSYALIRRDIDHYAGLEFDTVILDEAQHIKNRASQNAQAVKRVRAGRRVVLTGTPLENSVLDLWSIFDFLMPGYLGAAQDFKERYEVPIVRDRDAATQARLNRRLRPFVLRRLKQEVAPELPARIEQVALCDLTPEQQSAYTQILSAGRQELLAAVGAQGLAKSRMLVLTTLLRLRQISCDLRLLKLPGSPPAAPSGKLNLFAELLDEVLDGGHRALVFSQFVEMLSLLREHLDQAGVDYAYLDGSTRDRAQVVRAFQESATPVFLISLKAGGTGLNLTGADTVIHFDPWWNPAIEDQATGRAHRIGQTRVVTSYKLIARGTVEEKILKLQQRKREIAGATLAGEEVLADTFTWDEIQELLAD